MRSRVLPPPACRSQRSPFLNFAFEFPVPGARGDLAHALLTAGQAGKHLETIWLPLPDTIPANLYKQFMNYSILKLSFTLAFANVAGAPAAQTAAFNNVPSAFGKAVLPPQFIRALNKIF